MSILATAIHFSHHEVAVPGYGTWETFEVAKEKQRQSLFIVLGFRV